VADKNYLQVLRGSVKRELRRLTQFEGPVKAGEVEGVHDFRVALRRIRSALRLLEGDSEAKRIRKRASEFAADVGAMRDLDVLMLRRGLPDEWLLVLRLERQKALAVASDSLDSKRFRRWKRRVRDWLDDNAGDSPSVSDCLGPTLEANANGVLKHREVTDEKQFHELRIAVKRLRYTMEFFKRDLPPGLQPLIPRLSKVQDRLGEFHDVEVAIAKVTLAQQIAKDLDVANSLTSYLKVLHREKGRMKPEKAASIAIEAAEEISAAARK
jgi:CHAD domain-containing protein